MSELMARHDDIYKKRFLRVSDYIFSFVEEDVFALEQARQLGGAVGRRGCFCRALCHGGSLCCITTSPESYSSE
eukprot:scaffold5019_cov147-Skeletonema_menzelii.AAC.1